MNIAIHSGTEGGLGFVPVKIETREYGSFRAHIYTFTSHDGGTFTVTYFDHRTFKVGAPTTSAWPPKPAHLDAWIA